MVEDVIELQQALTHRVVLAFNAFLSSPDGTVEQGVLEGFAFLKGFFQQRGDNACIGEQAHQVVLKGDEETRVARIALARATTAELAVDAAGFVALGAEHVEATEFAHALAEADVGTAASHIGGDGDGTILTSHGDNIGFLLVVLGVQHLVRDAGQGEHAAERLGSFDRGCADEDRLSALVGVGELLDNELVLLAPRLEDDIVGVGADAGLVGRDGDHR